MANFHNTTKAYGTNAIRCAYWAGYANIKGPVYRFTPTDNSAVAKSYRSGLAYRETVNAGHQLNNA